MEKGTELLQSRVYCPFQDFLAPMAVLIASHSLVETAIREVPVSMAARLDCTLRTFPPMVTFSNATSQ